MLPIAPGFSPYAGLSPVMPPSLLSPVMPPNPLMESLAMQGIGMPNYFGNPMMQSFQAMQLAQTLSMMDPSGFPQTGYGYQAQPSFGYDPGYGQGYDPGYGQGYDPGYGQGFDPGFGQGYDPGYGQGFDPGFGQGYDPGYGYNPMTGLGLGLGGLGLGLGLGALMNRGGHQRPYRYAQPPFRTNNFAAPARQFNYRVARPTPMALPHNFNTNAFRYQAPQRNFNTGVQRPMVFNQRPAFTARPNFGGGQMHFGGGHANFGGAHGRFHR